VLQYPEYVQYSLAFVRSVEAVRAAAGARDLERAAAAYNEMTRSCIDCHRYVARMRLTREH
jgi:cytochrome c556